MTTYQITNISEGEVVPGGEFTLRAYQAEVLETVPRPYVPVHFVNNNNSITLGTGLPPDQWAAQAGPRHVGISRLSYRPTSERDVYGLLRAHAGIDVEPILGGVAHLITDLTLDTEYGRLPTLRATFTIPDSVSVAHVMEILLRFSGRPLHFIGHTFSYEMAGRITIDAEFIIHPQQAFRDRTETTYAPEPAPEQLPEAREPETRFREWSASVKGLERKG